MSEKNKIVADKITSLAEPLASSIGLSIWGVEVRLSSRSLVKVYAENADVLEDDAKSTKDLDVDSDDESEDYSEDADGNINIDQCAELSRLLGLSLEVEDLFDGTYVLEVSSPGLERLFFSAEQLKQAVGKRIEAKIYTPMPDFPRRRNFAGILESVDGEDIVIAVDVPEPAIANMTWSDIRRVQEVFELPETPRPGKPRKKSRRAAKRRRGKSNAKPRIYDKK